MELIAFDGDFDAAQKVFPLLHKEFERLRRVLPTLI